MGLYAYTHPHPPTHTLGIGGAVVLSFFYCILLQLVVGFITWLTLLLVNLALIACTLLCFQKVSLRRDV